MDKDDKDDGQAPARSGAGLALATSVTAGVGLGYMMIHSGVGEAMARRRSKRGRACASRACRAPSSSSPTPATAIKSFHRVSSAAPPTSLEAEVRGGLTLVDGAQTSKANGKASAAVESRTPTRTRRGQRGGGEEDERVDEMEAGSPRPGQSPLA